MSNDLTSFLKVEFGEMVAISFSLPVDGISDLSEDTFGERSFMGFIFIKVLPVDSVGSKFPIIEAVCFLKE